MKTTSVVNYLGNLRTSCEHTYSGAVFITDAPLDNEGLAQAFSPTDCVSTALASCMMTLMGIAARTHTIDLSGMQAEVFKVMASDPRRISEVKIIFSFERAYSQKEQAILENTARHCPVAKSLHPDINQNIQFNWQS